MDSDKPDFRSRFWFIGVPVNFGVQFRIRFRWHFQIFAVISPEFQLPHANFVHHVAMTVLWKPSKIFIFLLKMNYFYRETFKTGSHDMKISVIWKLFFIALFDVIFVESLQDISKTAPLAPNFGPLHAQIFPTLSLNRKGDEIGHSGCDGGLLPPSCPSLFRLRKNFWFRSILHYVAVLYMELGKYRGSWA